MKDVSTEAREPVVLAPAALQVLIDELKETGHQVFGPVVGNGAIVYDELAKVEQLPVGQTDDQKPGSYTLVPRADLALFGYTLGPHAWKRLLYPPVARLWRAERKGNSLKFIPEERATAPMAFIGVRACELAAIAIQDTVFLRGPYVDQAYQERRQRAFLVAVNCGQAGGTCFCASMGTGPKAASGYDIAMTEVVEPGLHHFVAVAGSDKGAAALAGLPSRKATSAEVEKADEVVAEAARHMGRSVSQAGQQDMLAQSYEHPRWEHVARRCLACSNCTMVCPTCFCQNVEDESDLSGNHAARWRKWDSCFGLDFSYIHGGSLRPSGLARYRQWLTHKFGSWIDQFGTSGCVGCGRCITWCPVGIDVTEELRALGEDHVTETSTVSV
jgi:sulfhydrogenase subunit beta (sulfur reductase)